MLLGQGSLVQTRLQGCDGVRNSTSEEPSKIRNWFKKVLVNRSSEEDECEQQLLLSVLLLSASMGSQPMGGVASAQSALPP